MKSQGYLLLQQLDLGAAVAHFIPAFTDDRDSCRTLLARFLGDQGYHGFEFVKGIEQ